MNKIYFGSASPSSSSSGSGGEGGAVTSVNNKTGDVFINKTDLGLGNVDNTSDLNKPVSTATQNALDVLNTSVVGKQPIGDYALKSEIPTKLPNPNVLTINGQNYDGSSPVEMTIEGGGGGGDVTTAQLNTAVEELESQIATKQPVGDYATSSELAQGLATKQATGNYALVSQLPDVSEFVLSSEIPTKLPNPQILTINGTPYDGSVKVDLNITSENGVALATDEEWAAGTSTIVAPTVKQVKDYMRLLGVFETIETEMDPITSNGTIGVSDYAVSYSLPTDPSTFGAYSATNKMNTGTALLHSDGSIPAVFPNYYTMFIKKGIALSSIFFQNRGDSPHALCSIKDFEVQSSEDGVDWVTIHENTNPNNTLAYSWLERIDYEHLRNYYRVKINSAYSINNFVFVTMSSIIPNYFSDVFVPNANTQSIISDSVLTNQLYNTPTIV